jgi:type VI secretion system secreted protein Hcp
MPTEIYVTITDADDNSLTEGAASKPSIGAHYSEPHEDKILCYGFHQRVSVPTDRRTGQITGTRRHEFVQLTKLIDKSSPLLYNTLSAPTDLEVEIEFYRNPDETSGGEKVHYYTITLEEAKIISIETISPNVMDQRWDEFTAFEEVTLTYGKITWNHEIGTTTAIDNWSGGE